MKCPKCGKQIPDDAEVCSDCNAVVTTDAICDTSQTPVITAQKQTSDRAIASLVLGISSLILMRVAVIGILPAILGFMLGWSAKRKISKQPDQMRGKGLAIGGIVTSTIGLLLGLIILLHCLLQVRELFRRSQCESNLSNIGRAMALYADKNQNHFPPTLEILLETKKLVPMNLVCPSSGDHEGQCSYIYRGNDLNANNLPVMSVTQDKAAMVVAYDKYRNHDGKMRHVLYVDRYVYPGNNWVERMTEEYFQKAIEIDNQLRCQIGLPEKPADEPLDGGNP